MQHHYIVAAAVAGSVARAAVAVAADVAPAVASVAAGLSASKTGLAEQYEQQHPVVQHPACLYQLLVSDRQRMGWDTQQQQDLQQRPRPWWTSMLGATLAALVPHP